MLIAAVAAALQATAQPVVAAPPSVVAPPPIQSVRPPEPTVSKSQGYVAFALPRVILTPSNPIARGAERVVHSGDDVLAAPTGFLWAATLNEPLQLEIAGKTATLPEGTLLLRSLASGGDIESLPSGRSIWCADPQFDHGQALAALLTLGIAKSRTDTITRLCLVDADGDKKFDRAFLVGTKRAEDQVTVPIKPAGYSDQKDMPEPSGRKIHFSYRGQRLLAGPAIFISLDSVSDNLAGVKTLGADGKVQFTRAGTAIDASKLPQTITLASAKITVLSIDPSTRDARIRIDQDLTETPLAVTLEPRVTYIYVP